MKNTHIIKSTNPLINRIVIPDDYPMIIPFLRGINNRFESQNLVLRQRILRNQLCKARIEINKNLTL